MEFSYRLVGTGWAEARIADESNWASLSASYLDDALGDLMEAVGVLLEGAEVARCSWAEEPGEYRWIFERSGPRVRLRILAFPGLWSNEPDENGTVCFETDSPHGGRMFLPTLLGVALTYGGAWVLFGEGQTFRLGGLMALAGGLSMGALVIGFIRRPVRSEGAEASSTIEQ